MIASIAAVFSQLKRSPLHSWIDKLTVEMIVQDPIGLVHTQGNPGCRKLVCIDWIPCLGCVQTDGLGRLSCQIELGLQGLAASNLAWRRGGCLNTRKKFPYEYNKCTGKRAAQVNVRHTHSFTCKTVRLWRERYSRSSSFLGLLPCKHFLVFTFDNREANQQTLVLWTPFTDILHWLLEQSPATPSKLTDSQGIC